MNKSFPTISMSRSLRWLSLVGVAALTGCVGYYPDPYPASPQPYYSGGGGGGYYEPYYNSAPYYYGPAYGSTTIYYERYSPGYLYRPGYGYYYPRPGYPSSGHHDDHDDHDNHSGGWADKGREVTGSNPGRYPHDRDSPGGTSSRPPNTGQPQGDRGGWSGRAPVNPGPRPQAPQYQQPSRGSSPPPPPVPQRNNDRNGDRGGWGAKARGEN